jgi:hypothetical protein
MKQLYVITLIDIYLDGDTRFKVKSEYHKIKLEHQTGLNSLFLWHGVNLKAFCITSRNIVR